MKKGLILSLSTVTILAVSAFAHNGEHSGMGMDQQHMMGNNTTNQHMMNNNNMQNQRMINQNMNGYMSKNNMMGQGMMYGSMMGNGMMMGHGMMGRMMILPKIMMLDLSTEQQEKISEILANNQGMENPLDAFTNNSFDEVKYAKVMQKNMDNMGKFCAQRISKIYNLLTAKQKKDLKSLLDAQNVMMKNRNSMMHNNMMNY